MIGAAVRGTIVFLILATGTLINLGHVTARQATPMATPAASILNETPGNVPVSLLVRNLGARDEVLLGASSPLADRVEVHHSRQDSGARVMEPTRGGLALPAGSTTILEPEGSHLMLIGTRDPLLQGDLFYLVLHFQRAGDVPVTGRVRRKLDAAGVAPVPPVSVGGIEVSFVSAPPAPAAR